MIIVFKNIFKQSETLCLPANGKTNNNVRVVFLFSTINKSNKSFAVYKNKTNNFRKIRKHLANS